jgi:inner membrane protein
MKDTLSRIFSSASFKFVIVGILSLVLLIPVVKIKNLIIERQDRNTEAILEVSEKWGLDQTILGPFLTIPLKETMIQNGKEEYQWSQLHILPEQLSISGSAEPQQKKRGIYKMVVYQSHLLIRGHFQVPESLLEQIGGQQIDNNTLFLCLGITDLRGIKEITIRVDGEVMDFQPGMLPERGFMSR